MLVRPKEAFISTAAEHPVTFAPGDTLDTDNPAEYRHVKAYPTLFIPVASTMGMVEQATANPGEKRHR